MQIEQRLQLTKQNSHSVCFIKDNPLFCKLYNESAYIFTKLLNRQLHVSVQQIKKLNNQTVLSAGFPIKSILKSFPNAQATNWGFILTRDFDLSGYQIWTKQIIVSQYLMQKPLLTQEQIIYLLTWEQSQNLTDIDLKLLGDLKRQLTSLIPNNI